MIEQADELDKTSLAIGGTGSAATIGGGAFNPAVGAVAGVVAIGVNTGYGVYAENEKEKLREEYRQWKNKVKNE